MNTFTQYRAEELVSIGSGTVLVDGNQLARRLPMLEPVPSEGDELPQDWRRHFDSTMPRDKRADTFIPCTIIAVVQFKAGEEFGFAAKGLDKSLMVVDLTPPEEQPDNDPTGAEKKDDEDQTREELIWAKMVEATEADPDHKDDKVWTRNGTPEVGWLNDQLPDLEDGKVTAAERDALWDELQSQED